MKHVHLFVIHTHIMPTIRNPPGKRKPKKKVQAMMAGPDNPAHPKNKKMTEERYEALMVKIKRAQDKALPAVIAHSSRYNQGPAFRQRQVAAMKKRIRDSMLPPKKPKAQKRKRR
jgi:hypothetical protein